MQSVQVTTLDGPRAVTVVEVPEPVARFNNISVVGVAWGEYALANPGYVQRQWGDLEPLIASGALAPLIGHTLPLDQAGEALALLEERRALGKVVLTVG